ncbi:ferroxidase fet3 [Borealophlyctis nickersoniae]|nr:ferroxidase fet3 [Borealophlyctis nickersoniae]
MTQIALFSAILALASTVSHAAVVKYDLDIGYLQNVNPDGHFPRRVITVNGKWPPPKIEANVNDTLVMNVKNSLDVPTSLHSHGLFFNTTNYFDGAAGVTQCGIPPGETFTYEFPLQQHGTYWYHSHTRGQYLDGFRGPLIIHPAKEVHEYDHEYTLILHGLQDIRLDDVRQWRLRLSPSALPNAAGHRAPLPHHNLSFSTRTHLVTSDWYHTEYEEVMKFYGGLKNPIGAEPTPDSGIILWMNGTQYVDTVTFETNKTYRIRVINMSGFAMFRVEIAGHTMDVIEADGVDMQTKTVEAFWIGAAQRYSVLVKAKNSTTENFPMYVTIDNSMFPYMPPTLNLST